MANRSSKKVTPAVQVTPEVETKAIFIKAADVDGIITDILSLPCDKVGVIDFKMFLARFIARVPRLLDGIESALHRAAEMEIRELLMHLDKGFHPMTFIEDLNVKLTRIKFESPTYHPFNPQSTEEIPKMNPEETKSQPRYPYLLSEYQRLLNGSTDIFGPMKQDTVVLAGLLFLRNKIKHDESCDTGLRTAALAEIHEATCHIEKFMDCLREDDFIEVFNRVMKTVEIINDTEGEVAEPETFDSKPLGQLIEEAATKAAIADAFPPVTIPLDYVLAIPSHGSVDLLPGIPATDGVYHLTGVRLLAKVRKDVEAGILVPEQLITRTLKEIDALIKKIRTNVVKIDTGPIAVFNEHLTTLFFEGEAEHVSRRRQVVFNNDKAFCTVKQMEDYVKSTKEELLRRIGELWEAMPVRNDQFTAEYQRQQLKGHMRQPGSAFDQVGVPLNAHPQVFGRDMHGQISRGNQSENMKGEWEHSSNPWHMAQPYGRHSFSELEEFRRLRGSQELGRNMDTYTSPFNSHGQVVITYGEFQDLVIEAVNHAGIWAAKPNKSATTVRVIDHLLRKFARIPQLYNDLQILRHAIVHGVSPVQLPNPENVMWQRHLFNTQVKSLYIEEPTFSKQNRVDNRPVVSRDDALITIEASFHPDTVSWMTTAFNRLGQLPACHSAATQEEFSNLRARLRVQPPLLACDVSGSLAILDLIQDSVPSIRFE